MVYGDSNLPKLSFSFLNCRLIYFDTCENYFLNVFDQKIWIQFVLPSVWDNEIWNILIIFYYYLPVDEVLNLHPGILTKYTVSSLSRTILYESDKCLLRSINADYNSEILMMYSVGHRDAVNSYEIRYLLDFFYSCLLLMNKLILEISFFWKIEQT